MFKKEELQKDIKPPQSSETIIGPSVSVEGNLISQGNIVVKGKVNGSITTQSILQLEKGGKILADIQAKSAVLWGDVKGNITINEKLEIKSTGSVQGDVITKTIIIEEGGQIQGNCKTGDMKQDSTQMISEKPNIEKKETNKEVK